MPLEQFDPVEAGIIGITVLLSLSACLYLAGVARKRPILAYEPRRPVPWNVVAIVPVALYMVSTIAAVWSQLTSTGSPPPPHTDDIIYNLAALILQQLLLFGGLFFAVAIAFHATTRDIGLPTSGRQFLKDIAIGVIAGIAALGPVHVVQAMLAHLMEPGQESQHPLVKMVQEGGADISVLILASIAAVVVAPICEELVFRLLLQGWLEKREDKRLGWRTPEAVESIVDQTSDSGADLPSTSVDITTEPTSHSEPPLRGPANLPHGWLPIIITAVLFGLAHTGYGPEPIPLFFLGLVLGYLYQRTHRIVPCIITHAIFNLFTVILLWRMAFFGSH